MLKKSLHMSQLTESKWTRKLVKVNELTWEFNYHAHLYPIIIFSLKCATDFDVCVCVCTRDQRRGIKQTKEVRTIMK